MGLLLGILPGLRPGNLLVHQDTPEALLGILLVRLGNLLGLQDKQGALLGSHLGQTRKADAIANRAMGHT